MSTPNIMTEAYSQEDWLKDIFSNTESDRSVKVAEQSLKVFDIFCEKQGQTRHEMIGRYQNWLKPEKIYLNSSLVLCLNHKY